MTPKAEAKKVMDTMDGKKVTPSQQCKQAGLKSLVELVETTATSEQTLINWSKNKPKLFATVIAGAVAMKGIDDETV